MILNINGHQKGNRVELSMPNIVLDSKLKYKVGLHRIYIELQDTSGLRNMNNVLLFLSTNLVDRSAINPQQSIVYFNYKDKTNKIQSHNTSNVIYYNLNLLELASASFDIHHFTDSSVKFPISKIFIQLEILRQDAYGRF